MQLADVPPVLSVEVNEGCAAEVAEIGTAPVERQPPRGQSAYASFLQQSARRYTARGREGERERESVRESERGREGGGCEHRLGSPHAFRFDHAT